MIGRHPRFIHLDQHVAIAQRTQTIEFAVLADRAGEGIARARLSTVTGSNNGAALAAAATDNPNNRPPVALPIDLDIILSLLGVK